MVDAFVLGGVRTPVGSYGGSLSHIRTDDLLGQHDGRRVRARRGRARAHRGHRRRVRQPRARGHGRHRPLGRARCGLSRLGPGDHGQPLLRLLAFRGDLDRPRDRARGARRRSRGRRRVDVALGLGADEGRAAVQPARAGVHARHDVGGRRRPAQPDAAGSGRLRRNDQDRAERRRPLRAHARGDRRVRAALAAQGRRGARLGPARAQRSNPWRSRRRAGSRRARSSTTRTSATTRAPRRWRRCRRSRTRRR